MMLATFSASDWVVLIPILCTSIATAIATIISSLQGARNGRAIETVHQVINSSADKLASSNAATISALTTVIASQGSPNASQVQQPAPTNQQDQPNPGPTVP